MDQDTVAMWSVRCGIWVAVACAGLALPASVHGQTASARVAVHGGGGVLLPGAGSLAWGGVGATLGDRVDLLVTLERQHVPTTVDGLARTRGGTVTAFGGELRVVPVLTRRVTPYAVSSFALGRSRLEVDEVFTDVVTNRAWLLLVGAGLRVGAGRHFSAFVDVRTGVQGELDVILLRTPLRVGATWRF